MQSFATDRLLWLKLPSANPPADLWRGEATHGLAGHHPRLALGHIGRLLQDLESSWWHWNTARSKSVLSLYGHLQLRVTWISRETRGVWLVFKAGHVNLVNLLSSDYWSSLCFSLCLLWYQTPRRSHRTTAFFLPGHWRPWGTCQ